MIAQWTEISWFVLTGLMMLSAARGLVFPSRLFSVQSRRCCAVSPLRMTASETIYALSSGQSGQSGVAVVRLSGPDSRHVLDSITTKRTKPVEPRRATILSLHCPKTREKLDSALVLWFPGPRSFTGEDVVEFHVHGSRAVLSGLFAAFEHLDVSTSMSIRAAERGEFTRRAFENGKMDLTEVEGLSDLLAADTSLQRKQALRQMDGHLRETYEHWRQQLMKCLAHTEAVIDFGDDDREGDINDHAMDALLPVIRSLHSELLRHLRDGRKGEIVREGLQLVLVGQPNAGKSSLMNMLARRPAAIVSPIAGTTRDIVEVRMDIGGMSCIVRDTAGLRSHSTDLIELEGIKRAKDAFADAHLRVFVVDVSDKRAMEESAELYSSLRSVMSDDDSQKPLIVAFNKADLLENDKLLSEHKQYWKSLVHHEPSSQIVLSCAQGLGLDAIEEGIASTISQLLQTSSDNTSPNGGDPSAGAEAVMITRERHRRHVRQCVEHLESFLSGELPMDLAAEEIRLAMQELGKVTGRVDVEELLDIIFRDFCIGK